ncbi:hypothetical protein CUMW_182250 [Citrus unshiu]|nr:hypothetical protein CUMW_182250 [Citrus unshiu]
MASMSHVKLVRWHPRPPEVFGAEFVPLLKHCKCLTSVDLSSITGQKISHRQISNSHLLKSPYDIVFRRSQEIIEITAARPNLNKWLVCLIRATNCPRLTLLHLAETSTLAALRGDPDDDGFTAEDARISKEGLIQLFNGLPLLEEFALDVRRNFSIV